MEQIQSAAPEGAEGTTDERLSAALSQLARLRRLKEESPNNVTTVLDTFTGDAFEANPEDRTIRFTDPKTGEVTIIQAPK